ncbi:MAG: HD domain-containing protein [Bacilli bacterium]|nr:HD domain-containing protein [Bacilli bacterium]
MKRMNAQEALNLLLKDVINDPTEIALDKNRWVRHCLYVGIAAGRIARAINANSEHYAYFKDYIDEYGPLDEDYAIALGYIHDIGRKINHPLHTTEGYRYLCDMGYEEEARSTLTHSFIDNDINNSADAVIGKDRYDFINNYLHSVELTPYDNIIQLCDLFCLETGFTTVEGRLLDITKRKGVYENSLIHFNKTMELFSRFELDDDYQELISDENGLSKDALSFYAIFPEISKESLDKRDEDRRELLEFIRGNMPDGLHILEKK